MSRMLIVKACGVTGESHECQNIKTQAEMYGIEVDLIEPNSIVDLQDGLSTCTYNYIYVSCHGNEYGLCNHDSSIDLNWKDFAVMLCDTECMQPECILMLSCCRGGLNQVAYELMYWCDMVDYVVGPRQSLTPDEMLISFSIILYYITKRQHDPIVACEKIKAATDIRFMCFDKLEVLAEPGFLMLKEKYDRLPEKTNSKELVLDEKQELDRLRNRFSNNEIINLESKGQITANLNLTN